MAGGWCLRQIGNLTWSGGSSSWEYRRSPSLRAPAAHGVSSISQNKMLVGKLDVIRKTKVKSDELNCMAMTSHVTSPREGPGNHLGTGMLLMPLTCSFRTGVFRILITNYRVL